MEGLGVASLSTAACGVDVESKLLRARQTEACPCLLLLADACRPLLLAQDPVFLLLELRLDLDVDSFFSLAVFFLFRVVPSTCPSAAAEVLGALLSTSRRSEEPDLKQCRLAGTGGSTATLWSSPVEVPGKETRRSTTIEVLDSKLVPERSRLSAVRF